ncbi:MAG: hypothetical protein OEZ02_09255 [Anaerolineae bacterium]|nr:hypothetical protein [Anaerolineae bacterium]
MKTKLISRLLLMGLLLLGLAACSSGEDDQPKFVGTWDAENYAILFSDDVLNDPDMGEYTSLKAQITFGSSGEFAIHVIMSVDFPTLLADQVAEMGESVEINAEVLELTISYTGTYEIVSQGEIQMSLDPNGFSFSPAEYCFSMAGEESCEDLSDIADQGTDISGFDSGAAFYEFSGAYLYMWDDECDYPNEKDCALKLTK